MEETVVVVRDRDHLMQITQEVIPDGTKLVLDVSAVRYIASTDLGTLMTIGKRAAEDGGQLAIRNSRPAVREVIKVTKLEDLLGLED